MRTAASQIIGIVLIFTAIFGILFSLIAIIQIWRFKPRLEAGLSGELQLLDKTLTTTQDGLAVVKGSLDTASTNVDSLESATETLAQSLQDSNPLMESLVSLVGKDLPATITATQTSLTSAQTSAVLIDNTLATISKIPFLGLGRYQPDVPLNVALGEVSTSLNDLPASLKTIKASLETAQTNLDVMEKQMTSIGKDVRQFNEDLSSARSVIDDYQSTARELQSQVTAARQALPGFLNSGAWLLTFVLFWLGMTQIGLLTQGLEIIKRERS